jgi:transposase-like protein
MQQVRPGVRNEIASRRSDDKLHLDEVALKINGCRHWLWRAVDQRGLVLDIPGAEPARSARG